MPILNKEFLELYIFILLFFFIKSYLELLQFFSSILIYMTPIKQVLDIVSKWNLNRVVYVKCMLNTWHYPLNIILTITLLSHFICLFSNVIYKNKIKTCVYSSRI